MHKKFDENYYFYPQKVSLFKIKPYLCTPMNTLSHHIECLLLHHDCVVVPQFGAFITMDTASTRVDSEDMFFPPLRVVRFHPNLTEDDGLLVDSLRAAMHQSATETKRMVQRMVLELRQQLLADGQVDFGSLGQFSQDEDGRVSFEPCQAGAVTPSYFGLDSFVMPRLSALQRRTLDVARQENEAANTDDSHITIRLNRRVLRYVAGAAAAILIAVLFSTSVTDPAKEPQQASILSIDTPKAIINKPVVDVPVVVETPVTTSQTTVAQPAQEDVVAQPIDESGYCIVLASNVSKKNAEIFVNRLQEMGLARVRIMEKGKVRRVIIDGFATQEEAAQHNVEIHRRGGELAYSWVMKL